MQEKGSVGAVIAIIVGVALIGAVGFLAFTRNQTGDGATQKPQGGAAQVPSEIDANNPDAMLERLDDLVYVGFFGKGVYYKTYSATPVRQEKQIETKPQEKKVIKATKNKKETYRIIPGADSATFSEIKSIPVTSSQTPFTSDGGTTEITYYRDDNQVFVAQTTTYPSGETESSVEVVVANPSSFQILNDTYAKDDEHVYLVSWVCQGETCTLVLEIVYDADPATFHVIEETEIQQSDGTGTVVADAIDATHVFNDGVVVDTIETPGSEEESDKPVLISP